MKIVANRVVPWVWSGWLDANCWAAPADVTLHIGIPEQMPPASERSWLMVFSHELAKNWEKFGTFERIYINRIVDEGRCLSGISEEILDRCYFIPTRVSPVVGKAEGNLVLIRDRAGSPQMAPNIMERHKDAPKPLPLDVPKAIEDKILNLIWPRCHEDLSKIVGARVWILDVNGCVTAEALCQMSLEYGSTAVFWNKPAFPMPKQGLNPAVKVVLERAELGGNLRNALNFVKKAKGSSIPPGSYAPLAPEKVDVKKLAAFAAV